MTKSNKNTTCDLKDIEKSHSNSQHFIELAALMNQGVLECDMKGMITFSNDAFNTLYGSNKKEYSEKKIWEVIDDDLFRDHHKTSISVLVNKLPSPHFTKLMNCAVETIDVKIDWIHKKNDDEKLSGFVLLFSNTSSPSQCENVLESTQVFHNKLMDETDEIIVALDTYQLVTMINKRGCQILELEESQILGRNWFSNFLPSQHSEFALQEFNELLESGKEKFVTYENEVVSAGGKKRVIKWRTSLLRDDYGRIQGTFFSGVDISKRIQAEQQLRLTQFSVDSCNTLIYWVRPDATFIYANDAAVRHSGYSRDELLSLTLHDLNPAYPEADWQKFLKVIEQEKTLTIQTTHRHKDGHFIPMEVTVNFLEYEGEKFLFSFCYDLTERISAEQHLRLTQLSLDSCDTPVYWIRRDASIIYVNNAAVLQSGYSRDEILSLTIRDLNSEFQPDHWPRFIKELEKEKSLKFQTKHRHKNGHNMIMDVTVTLLDYKGEHIALAFVNDITKDKKLDLQMKLTQFTIDNSSTPIYWVRRDARFYYSNLAGSKLLGYPIEELLSMTIHDIDPDYPPGSWEEHWDSMLTERSRTFETKLEHKDGHFLPVEIDTNMFEYEGEQVVFAVVTDITNRKLSEKESEEVSAAVAKIALLSPRENETVWHVVKGFANKVIARKMGISEKTVEKHRSSLMKKLDVNNIAELIHLGLLARKSQV